MGDMNDDEGWDKVASWLKSETEKQGLTLRRIEVDGGVAYRTVQKLLAGQPVDRRDALARLSTFLGYQADAIDRIRRGEQPVPEFASDIDLNSAAGSLSPKSKRDVLDYIREQERKQQP